MRGHVVAYAGKFLQLGVVLGEVFDALVDAVEQLGHFLVAAVAADDRAIDLQQLRRLPQILATSRFSMWLPCAGLRGRFYFFRRGNWKGVQCGGTVSPVRFPDYDCANTAFARAISFNTCSRKASSPENFCSSRRRRWKRTSIGPAVSDSGKIEQIRFDRQALAIERRPDADVRHRPIVPPEARSR